MGGKRKTGESPRCERASLSPRFAKTNEITESPAARSAPYLEEHLMSTTLDFARVNGVKALAAISPTKTSTARPVRTVSRTRPCWP